MNKSKRQVVAEKIASTVRVLELLGLEYEVRNNKKKTGGRSPRVIEARLDKKRLVWIYNSAGGSTWANRTDGTPIPSVHSIEDLYEYLSRELS